MDKDILLILVGAGIGLFSSFLTSLLQYFLSIKMEEHRRKKTEAKEKQIGVRDDLIRGVKDFDPAAIRRQQLREKLLKGEEIPAITVPEGYLGCFSASTRITLPDQKYCSIKDIKSGDQVLTFDFRSKMFSIANVDEVMFGEASEVMVINEKISVTESHPFITSNGFSIKAGNIHLQEILFCENGALEEVTSVRLSKEKLKVYNLKLSNNRPFFAEGFLVGDFSMK